MLRARPARAVQSDLIDAVTRLRARITAGAAAIPGAQRASDESLRQRLDGASAEIERLRIENTALRDQVARALGEQRIRR